MVTSQKNMVASSEIDLTPEEKVYWANRAKIAAWRTQNAQIVNDVVYELVRSASENIDNLIYSIVEKNFELTRSVSFTYRSEVFLHPNLMGGAKGARGSLDPSLREELNAALKLRKDNNSMVEDIKRLLGQCLEECTCLQDVRDVLPECIIPLTPKEIKALPRTREEGCLLTKPQHKEQFKRLEDTFFLFLGSRLLG